MRGQGQHHMYELARGHPPSMGGGQEQHQGRCIKQIWKVGKVDKVGKVGMVGRKGR